jgi:hypothetical protein
LEQLSPIPILISPPTPSIKNASNELLQPHFIGEVQVDKEDSDGRVINRSGYIRRSLWNRITGRGRRMDREGIASERDGVRDL